MWQGNSTAQPSQNKKQPSLRKMYALQLGTRDHATAMLKSTHQNKSKTVG
jgi:hypothetical protein